MSIRSGLCEWSAVACSRRGASHIRNDLPNQDSAQVSLLDRGNSAIAAVADGHGSSRSFRSHVGSAFAVDTAIAVCAEFLADFEGATATEVKSAGDQFLFARIWHSWRQRVQDHFAAEPFTAEELSALEARDGQDACEKAMRPEQLFVAYGATLLLTAMTPQFMICIQHGDGTIAFIGDDSEDVTFVVPVAREAVLAVNETASICDDDAPRKATFRFVSFANGMPACVMLSTDGYWNSFKNPEDSFPRVVREYAALLRQSELALISARLPGWLDDVSRQGVGDDTSAAFIWRAASPLAVPTDLQSQYASDGSVSASDPPASHPNAEDQTKRNDPPRRRRWFM